MQNRQIAARTTGLVFVIGLLMGAGAPIAAAGGSTEDDTLAQSRAIEGVWEPVVTIVDCQSQTPLFSFLSMDSYIRGGSYVGESASEPAIRATGLGTWRHAGGRNFTAVYQFFTYAPDGTPTGKLKVSARIRLSADGKSFRTSDSAEVSDLNGTVVAQVCGYRVATRFE